MKRSAFGAVTASMVISCCRQIQARTHAVQQRLHRAGSRLWRRAAANKNGLYLPFTLTLLYGRRRHPDRLTDAGRSRHAAPRPLQRMGIEVAIWTFCAANS